MFYPAVGAFRHLGLIQGAKSIQNWLNMCAQLIAKSIPADQILEAMEEYKAQRVLRGRSTVLPADRLKKEQMTPVVWTTPLGLPIVQPYRKIICLSDPNSPAEGRISK
jgi:DNA-directed RNA polymerase